MSSDEVKITFESAQGDRIVVAPAGQSLMEIAVRENVPGIVGECGGSLTCATCHVIVSTDRAGDFPEPCSDELDMIEFLDGAEPTSRLACQLRVESSPDGLVVRVP